MAEIRDQYGNPVQLTDEHGNPVQLTDEHGHPMHLTGVATTKIHDEPDRETTGGTFASTGVDVGVDGAKEHNQQLDQQKQQHELGVSRSSSASSGSVSFSLKIEKKKLTIIIEVTLLSHGIITITSQIIIDIIFSMYHSEYYFYYIPII